MKMTHIRTIGYDFKQVFQEFVAPIWEDDPF